MTARLLVVAGYPGTGKTSLARRLGKELQWPLVGKDMVKEALFDTLGIGDEEWSHRLGAAAMRVLFAQVHAVLAVGAPVIAEANFDAELSRGDFLHLLADAPSPVVRVVLQCEPDVLTQRFRSRAESGERHAGHLDALVMNRLIALVQQPYVPPSLPGPLIEVDATDLEAVDFDALTARVRAAFG